METGLPFVIVKKRSGEVAGRRLEGELYAGERVAVVEDVLTTGVAAIDAATRVGEVGANVLAIVAVIDREQGAAQRIASAGYECRALFLRGELGV